ncbi:hypothetical protein V1523DRAFT_399652 [Lipomyces doorenjongii]
MAPRSRKDPVESLNFQIIDFPAVEDTVQSELPIAPQLLEGHPESHPEWQSSRPSTPSQPSTTVEDQSDRIDWTPEMIHAWSDIIANRKSSRTTSAVGSTPSVPKRSRGPLEPSGSTHKRQIEEDPILAAVNRSMEARKSNIMKAIEILAEEYYGRLSEVDFGRATDVLSDEVKASVFVSLPLTAMKDK